MVGSIIGGALGAVGSIFGGISKRKAAKKQAKILEQQKAELGQRKAENETWYNRRYNEDSTQRADAQKAMQMARDTMKDRYNQATASAAVTGATDESIAAQKAAANQVLADTTSNIVVQGDARKDSIEQQYMNNKDNLASQGMNLANQEMGIEAQKANAMSSAIQGVASAGAGIAGIDGLFKK